jgi:hypothetical protein
VVPLRSATFSATIRVPPPEGRPANVPERNRSQASAEARRILVHLGTCSGRRRLRRRREIDGVKCVSRPETPDSQYADVWLARHSGFARLGENSLPISEAYLMPGLYSGNGSEYINHTIEKGLNALSAEFSKSGANRTQDHALVDCRARISGLRSTFMARPIPPALASPSRCPDGGPATVAKHHGPSPGRPQLHTPAPG